VESPLGRGGEGTVGHPHDQIAEHEDSYSHRRLLLLSAPSIDGGVQQDQGRRRGHHHGEHHHRPHEEQEHEIDKVPGLRLRHGHPHRRVPPHLCHVAGQTKEVEPRQDYDPSEPCRHDRPITPEDGCERCHVTCPAPRVIDA
jgi:hypothetical protein